MMLGIIIKGASELKEHKSRSILIVPNVSLATFPWLKGLPHPELFDDHFPNIPPSYKGIN